MNKEDIRLTPKEVREAVRNCDGETDEDLVRDCSNECDDGLQKCIDGVWQACTATDACSCLQESAKDIQVCGNCGERERTCVSGTWSNWSACVEYGDCIPGYIGTRSCDNCGRDMRVCGADCRFGPWLGCVSVGGSCIPDEKEEESCGDCGETRERVRNQSCSWGDWSQCETPPTVECGLFDVDSRDCASCGTQVRTCSASCTWNDWGSCTDQGECDPGPPAEEDAQSCGSCKVQLRTCRAGCTWGNWGACLDQGQCTLGQTDNDPCGLCGTKTRSCTAGCLWGSWGNCIGQGVCQPFDTDSSECGDCLPDKCDTGECQAGTWTRTCTSSCQWGSWSSCQGNIDPGFDHCGDGLDQDCDGYDISSPDIYEFNNSCSSAYAIPDEDPNMALYASIDVATDYNDYFYFSAKDNSLPINEKIKIWLEDIPSGADFDFCLYKAYANCVSDNALACSDNLGTADEYIEFKEMWPGDDTDEYYVRVYRIYGNSCYNDYKLTINGLR